MQQVATPSVAQRAILKYQWLDESHLSKCCALVGKRPQYILFSWFQRLESLAANKYVANQINSLLNI